MRRAFASVVLLTVALLFQGCQDEYFEKLDNLKQRTADIDSQCMTLNANILSLQAIVKAIQSNDLITGVTDIKEDGKIVGYRINFVNSSPVSIYDGIDGSVPYVGTRTDSEDGNMYWTIQYGLDGSVQWLKDKSGNKVLAVGLVPYLRIREDKWFYSFDRSEWIELGQAKGADADAMFKKINISNEDCVIITLADDTVLKVPTLAEYQALSRRVSEINEAARAQGALVKAAVDKLVYIEKVEAVLDGKDTVGTFVKLSNGDQFTVRDWKGDLIPCVRAVRDSSDGMTYWAVQYGGEPYRWILSADDTRIKATSGDVDVPQISIEQKKGNFYWKVSVKDTSWFVKNAAGDSVATAAKCVAVDTVQSHWFKSVKEGTDFLEITLNDEAGTVVKLPFKYTVSFEIQGKPVADTVKVTAPDTVNMKYSVTGSTVNNLTVAADGGLKVENAGSSTLRVIVPSGFKEGSVMTLFTFGEAESVNTKVKIIKFIQEGGDEN